MGAGPSVAGDTLRHRSTRKKVFIWLAIAVVGAAALMLGAGGAFGGPSPSVFELDGNATNDPAVAGEDWDNVYGHTSSAFSTVFIDGSVEAPANDATAWTPSTNIADPISAWSWQTNANVVDDKANITDAYAAAYKADTTDPASHTDVYFGLDRFANNGDANVAFWFLQDNSFK